MPRIAYVNGRYVPLSAAVVSIEDRGYQFADGVYEVIAVRGGNLINAARHLDRLARSLSELRIAEPVDRRTLEIILRQVVRRNRLREGMLYMQITRGVAPRDHAFPPYARPSLVITARRGHPPSQAMIEEGVSVITIPDIRWKRCDIKSIALLPNVLGKQQAREAGAFEAWQVDSEGLVTEGTSTNAWIVTQEDEIVTRQADDSILGGITRARLVEILGELGLTLAERAFSLDEALQAREAFLTSTTSLVLPVVQIDETAIGEGVPGPVAQRLRAIYAAKTEAEGARA